MKTSHGLTAGSRIVLASLLLVVSMFAPVPAEAGVIQFDIPSPAGSVDFGKTVTALPNGNFVVTDPRYDTSRGAVYLYSPQGVLINRITGSISSSAVGSGGITVLANGNFVISSPDWALDYLNYSLGAVTWCSGITGCSGTVSAANSLVGSTKSDRVGYDFFGGVVALPNGNYVVPSPAWDNGSATDAGAVTWGNGAGGTVGAVSPSNSLVGSTKDDNLGSSFDGGITVLTNGNYLVRSPNWNNGSVVDAGAVTFGNGTSGSKGVVSASNSLAGSRENDRVGVNGSGDVIELTNGNYVVVSINWDLDATHQDVGAVTWGSGITGVAGAISPSNSLVGASSSAPAGDRYVENLGVNALTNGNYVVNSPYWSLDGSASHHGAATWGSGTTGVAGQISADNSLVGSAAGDYVGLEMVALTNGNYVVVSTDVSLGDDPHTGAVTWGDGDTGISGAVSASNSLVGAPLTLAGGGGVIALANGNYVVSTPAWYNEAGGPSNVGAVTWGNGATGITGPISTTNSLLGSSTYDSIGDGGLVALTNGNYVVVSKSMGNKVGFVTWRDGSIATSGVVTTTNSLVGSTANDQVGCEQGVSAVTPLANGNYVVRSPAWDHGGIVDAGAATWGNGASGTIGVVSAGNSLVGSATNDKVGGTQGGGGVFALSNGNYVVSVPQWDHAGMADVGAVTWVSGAGGLMGVITELNSLVGSKAGDLVGNGSFYEAESVVELANGDYVVSSSQWSSATAFGAVTWADGMSGITGEVSEANSLVNTNPEDYFYSSTITLLPDGKASVHFPDWVSGSSDGAVSLIGGGSCNPLGPVSAFNSVLGSAMLGGTQMVSDYDPLNGQLIVGRPSDQKVTILRCLAGAVSRVYLPLLTR